MEKKYVFSVFTKPWQNMPVKELGEFVSKLGFDAIEFPVRPGYQVEPENVKEGLPKLARELKSFGIDIASIAGPTDEDTFIACATAGIPVIRVMCRVEEDGYLASEKKARKDLESLLPLCEKYNVKIGVQNHYGKFVSPNSAGLMRLVEKFDPNYIGVIWDAAHNALGGEEPEMGLDIVWSHLCMVNLKNAFWRRKTGPELEAEWEIYWTSGKQGLASWRRVAEYLKKRNYRGVICLTAEYTTKDEVDRLIAEDIKFARSLFYED
ncbi:MAG TPA: sugar phosphate isomerase/epimerase family protein [bacterium]|nr:sugar phosphate isomerase/epimerase family protein [bacterium]